MKSFLGRFSPKARKSARESDAKPEVELTPCEPDTRDLLEAPQLSAREERLFDKLERAIDGETLLYPVLPDPTLEALRLIDDPDADFDDIERALSHDQELSDEILRTANSVWFGARTTIEDLRSGLLRLGNSNTRNLLLGVSLKMALIEGPFPIDKIGEEIFRHSMATGALARMMAPKLGMNRDQAFLTGLLHDLGKVSLLATISELQRHEDAAPTRSGIHEMLRVRHQETGVTSARRWGLSDDVIDCASLHHTPQDAGDHRREAAVVNIANRVAHTLDDQSALDEDEQFVLQPGHIAQCVGAEILELSSSLSHDIYEEGLELLDKMNA